MRQDKGEQATFGTYLVGKPPGRRLAADALLGGSWTRLWVFRGGVGTQPIEDRIGIPFPSSGIATPLELVPGRRPGSVRLTAVATASTCR